MLEGWCISMRMPMKRQSARTAAPMSIMLGIGMMTKRLMISKSKSTMVRKVSKMRAWGDRYRRRSSDSALTLYMRTKLMPPPVLTLALSVDFVLDSILNSVLCRCCCR